MADNLIEFVMTREEATAIVGALDFVMEVHGEIDSVEEAVYTKLKEHLDG